MRLDQLLRVWEDRCFILSLRVRMQLASGRSPPCPLDGPLIYWRELRSYVLGYRQEQVFDAKRFLGSADTQNALYPDSTLPLDLISWSSSSRRVFRVSSELQLLLEATNLGDFHIEDIPWPFDSFVVLLETPIHCLDGSRSDVILVTTCEKVLHRESTLVQIQLLPQHLGDREFLPDRVVNDFEDALKDRRVNRMQKLISRWGKVEKPVLRTIFSIDKFAAAYVAGSAFQTAKDSVKSSSIQGNLNPDITEYPHWDAAVRVVAGLCLYLKSLPTKSSHAGDWVKPPSVPDWNAIINTAQLCSVASVHTLTTKEYQKLRQAVDEESEERREGSTRQVRTHYRRGHWRKAPGYGNIPDAPKVIHVRPTLVRRDRLPEGAAPGGSETRFKS